MTIPPECLSKFKSSAKRSLITDTLSCLMPNLSSVFDSSYKIPKLPFCNSSKTDSGILDKRFLGSLQPWRLSYVYRFFSILSMAYC